MTTGNMQYGSIPSTANVGEESPLLRVEDEDIEVDSTLIHCDGSEEIGVYENSSSGTSSHCNNKKKYERLLVAIAMIAVVACFVAGPVAPINAAMGKAGGPWAPGGAPGTPFNWTAYGDSIKQYWADKKAAWHKSKAEMKAANVTAPEYKLSKKMFWNSSTDGFADVLNITQAAERQADADENEAAP